MSKGLVVAGWNENQANEFVADWKSGLPCEDFRWAANEVNIQRRNER